MPLIISRTFSPDKTKIMHGKATRRQSVVRCVNVTEPASRVLFFRKDPGLQTTRSRSAVSVLTRCAYFEFQSTTVRRAP